MYMQRMMSNGKWTDENEQERQSYFIGLVTEMESWFAERQGREPMTTPEQVIAQLATGVEVRYGQDWHALLRDGQVANRAKLQRQLQPAPAETLCACGHTSAHPMTTAYGTACLDCYDRMSD